MERRRKFLIIIFLVVVIPGYIRIFYSNAFDFVRTVDIVQLLATGILTGILLMAAIDYFRMKKVE